jgi:hypothetical protein
MTDDYHFGEPMEFRHERKERMRLRRERREAAKRYHHNRRIREGVLGIISLALAAVPIWYGFGRTDMIAWYAGLIIMVRLEWMHMHIRALQVHVAWIHDEIDRLTGKEGGGGHMLDEYSAGP